MAQVETVVNPPWWDSATSVQMTTVDQGTTYSAARADTVLLPEGISMPLATPRAILVPWSNIRDLIKVE